MQSDGRVEMLPVMSKKDRWEYRFLIIVWITANLFFWTWWLQENKVGTPILFALMSLAFFYDTTFLPTFYTFYLGHMRKPKPMSADLARQKGIVGKVAMITLTVPGSESIDIVRKQLIAMTRVKYPHESWILVDKVHSPKIKALAKSLGVNYFSRHDKETWGALQVKLWNQSAPPFKAKTKAGNVNAWLNAFGDQFTHFTQLDVDHLPKPEYLDKVLGYFNDPEVAWVQAPSIYGNLKDWPARGSAEQEFVLQGPLQSGFFGFCKTPFIIGSHSTYKMLAIREIGGFQPTRAEDHLDTVFLAAKGWKGVFVQDIIAVGDGPENFETYMSQQFAWAYSMVQVLFNFTPKAVKNYTLKQAIQFLFVQTWYTLWSTSLFALFVLPIIALLINKPIANVGYFDFMLHSLPIMIVALSIWFWSAKWHNPKGFGLSWRGIVLHIARWPVVLSALIQVILKVEKPYMITVKGLQKGEKRPFLLKGFIPYFFLVTLSLASCWTYIILTKRSETQGYLLFALQGAITVLLVFLVALINDIKDMIGEKVTVKRSLSLRIKPIILLAVIGGAIAITSYASAGRIVEAITFKEDGKVVSVLDTPAQRKLTLPTEVKVANIKPEEEKTKTPTKKPIVKPSATASPTLIPRKTETPVSNPTISPQVGLPVVNLPKQRMFLGVYDKQSQTFAKKSLDVEMDFFSWEKSEEITRFIREERNKGRVPIVSIEPWTTTSGNPSNVIEETGRETNGRALNDPIIVRNAEAVKAHEPQVVLIRFAQEMELLGNYPWSQASCEAYRLAFRHYHDLFVSLGVTNAKWIWSPAGNSNSSCYYPGDNYVDYIGVTVLGHEAWDMKFGNKEGRSFASIFGEKYNVVSVHNKPIIVVELGVAPSPTRSNPGEYRKAWLKDAFNSFGNYPLLAGVVYFNSENAPTSPEWGIPDWRIDETMLWDKATMPKVK